MIRVLAAVGLVVGLLAMSPAAAAGAALIGSQRPGVEASGVGEEYLLRSRGAASGDPGAPGGPQQGEQGRTPGGPASDGGPVVRFQTLLIPACGTNSPYERQDALCTSALLGCPPGEVRAWAYRSPVDVRPPVWARNGIDCIGPDVPGADGRPVTVDVTVEDFRRVPLPPATSVVQPPGGQVLVNIETNAYAAAERVVVPTEVLGQAVRVRATPVRYAWDYGDGATLGPTPDPGGPHPDLTNAHVYTAPGTYRVTLTTTYAGEFSVGGGPWLPIDGTAEVTSPPQRVTAHALRNELVAGGAG